SAAHACAEQNLALMVDLFVDDISEETVGQWAERLAAWCSGGAEGYCCHGLQAIPAASWARLIQAVRTDHPDCVFMAWTPGLTPPQIAALKACGFLYTFNSLPWWDCRSGWLMEEQERLSSMAPD